MKKLFKLITILLFFAVNINTVFAASYKESIKVSSMGKYNYGGTYYFPIKYTSDGDLAYCVDFKKDFPMGHTMNRPSNANNGLINILENGYKGTVSDMNSEANRKSYYITQLAIYTYLGQANPSNNNAVHKAVWDLVNKAKNAPNYSQELSIKLASNGENMKLVGNYYTSEAIKVQINKAGNYSVSASQNVNATVVNAQGQTVTSVKNGDTVYLRMPATSIKEGQTATVSMTVSGSTSIKKAYIYSPSQSNIQKMLLGKVYSSTNSAKANFSAKAYKKVVEKETEVIVSKKDLDTKKELAGATLVIKDMNGKTLATIKTNGIEKAVKGLKPGFYTLEETSAPAGYKLSTDKVKFQAIAGETVKVTFYNEKEEVEIKKVKISKQDIATKTELPGATLIIKDATGKEIKRWVSTNEAVYFELAKGTYYLEEVIAPDGYILSTESIKFTVNEFGLVDREVIMYNTREVKVPITASNASILMYGIGLLTMIFGFTKVVKNAK